jgi:hypothetical protein
MKQLRHDHILRTFGASRNPGDPFLVCAFKPQGDVNSFLHKNPRADRRKLVRTTGQHLCSDFVHPF